MRTLKLYAAITATANAVANLLIPRNGRIKSIRWAVDIDAPADNASVAVDLNTQTITVLASNDIPSIAELRALVNLSTSGAYLGAIKAQEFLDYPVAAGDRIYIHAVVAGTVTARITAFIDIDEGR